MTEPIVELSDVVVDFAVAGGGIFTKESLRALRGVSLLIAAGETLGIVGESGCGKSTLARVLVGLQPPTSGSVHLKGQEIYRLRDRSRRRYVGTNVGLVFQDPATALNGRLPVRRILRDPLDVHRRGTPPERDRRVKDLLDLVGLPASAADMAPRQLSGGQRQRVAIARALALEPSVIVADEPTSALDVSVRAQILNLLLDLKSEMNMTIVFISHDIQTVRRISDRIVTMYLGYIVEELPQATVPQGIAHPYTKALFSATPSLLDPGDPIILGGSFPSAVRPPSGCPFSTRCWCSAPECTSEVPALRLKPETVGHRYRCWHPLGEESSQDAARLSQPLEFRS